MEKRPDGSIVLKSNMINALLPDFFKHLFYNALTFSILYLVYLLVDYSAKIDRHYEFILFLIFITLLYSFIKILKNMFIILNTTYTFYSNHLEVKFKFVKEDTHSINYKQITDITVNKTIWDRICQVGNVEIHTANDSHTNEKTKALVLKDVKHADKIQEELTRKIHSYHSNNSH